MDQKRATEIYDYIEEHQDDSMTSIAKALNISQKSAFRYATEWAIKPRGEFIYALTKEDGTDEETGRSS